MISWEIVVFRIGYSVELPILQNRVCVVTGACYGISKASTSKFLDEGARNWICDVVTERAEQAVHDLVVLSETGGGSENVSGREEV